MSTSVNRGLNSESWRGCFDEKELAEYDLKNKHAEEQKQKNKRQTTANKTASTTQTALTQTSVSVSKPTQNLKNRAQRKKKSTQDQQLTQTQQQILQTPENKPTVQKIALVKKSEASRKSAINIQDNDVSLMKYLITSQSPGAEKSLFYLSYRDNLNEKITEVSRKNFLEGYELFKYTDICLILSKDVRAQIALSLLKLIPEQEVKTEKEREYLTTIAHEILDENVLILNQIENFDLVCSLFILLISSKKSADLRKMAKFASILIEHPGFVNAKFDLIFLMKFDSLINSSTDPNNKIILFKIFNEIISHQAVEQSFLNNRNESREKKVDFIKLLLKTFNDILLGDDQLYSKFPNFAVNMTHQLFKLSIAFKSSEIKKLILDIVKKIPLNSAFNYPNATKICEMFNCCLNERELKKIDNGLLELCFQLIYEKAGHNVGIIILEKMLSGRSAGKKIQDFAIKGILGQIAKILNNSRLYDSMEGKSLLKCCVKLLIKHNKSYPKVYKLNFKKLKQFERFSSFNARRTNILLFKEIFDPDLISLVDLKILPLPGYDTFKELDELTPFNALIKILNPKDPFNLEKFEYVFERFPATFSLNTAELLELQSHFTHFLKEFNNKLNYKIQLTRKFILFLHRRLENFTQHFSENNFDAWLEILNRDLLESRNRIQSLKNSIDLIDYDTDVAEAFINEVIAVFPKYFSLDLVHEFFYEILHRYNTPEFLSVFLKLMGKIFKQSEKNSELETNERSSSQLSLETETLDAELTAAIGYLNIVAQKPRLTDQNLIFNLRFFALEINRRDLPIYTEFLISIYAIPFDKREIIDALDLFNKHYTQFNNPLKTLNFIYKGISSLLELGKLGFYEELFLKEIFLKIFDGKDFTRFSKSDYEQYKILQKNVANFPDLPEFLEPPKLLAAFNGDLPAIVKRKVRGLLVKKINSFKLYDLMKKLRDLMPRNWEVVNRLFSNILKLKNKKTHSAKSQEIINAKEIKKLIENLNFVEICDLIESYSSIFPEIIKDEIVIKLVHLFRIHKNNVPNDINKFIQVVYKNLRSLFAISQSNLNDAEDVITDLFNFVLFSMQNHKNSQIEKDFELFDEISVFYKNNKHFDKFKEIFEHNLQKLFLRFSKRILMEFISSKRVCKKHPREFGYASIDADEMLIKFLNGAMFNAQRFPRKESIYLFNFALELIGVQRTLCQTFIKVEPMHSTSRLNNYSSFLPDLDYTHPILDKRGWDITSEKVAEAIGNDFKNFIENAEIGREIAVQALALYAVYCFENDVKTPQLQEALTWTYETPIEVYKMSLTGAEKERLRKAVEEERHLKKLFDSAKHYCFEKVREVRSKPLEKISIKKHPIS